MIDRYCTVVCQSTHQVATSVFYVAGQTAHSDWLSSQLCGNPYPCILLGTQKAKLQLDMTAVILLAISVCTA